MVLRCYRTLLVLWCYALACTIVLHAMVLYPGLCYGALAEQISPLARVAQCCTGQPVMYGALRQAAQAVLVRRWRGVYTIHYTV
jgi:hypothetical protein